MQQALLPRWLIVALIIALLGLVTGGSWFYRVQAQHLRQQREDELQAIAQLKAYEIAAWRAGRLGDGALLSDSPLFVEGVIRWIANPQDDLTEALLTQFTALQTHYQYSDVLLVDPAGTVLLSLSGSIDALHDATSEALIRALHDRQPMLTDLYRGSDDVYSNVTIDVVAPLFPSSDLTAEPVGAIILQSAASEFLYSFIQSWPTPSESAETLLVRSDGDFVLFLNELRHQTDTALALRIPLSQTEVPAVKAVLGAEDIVQGKDYRGVEVLAALHAVPDSPWFVIAKMDKAEIFADWRLRSSLFSTLFLSSLVIVVTIGGVLWQRNQKRYYQLLLQAERTKYESETRYQTILLSIGDGIIVTDGEGQIVLLNPVAETLTGWSQHDAQGKPLEEIFYIVDEETHQPVENLARRVMREGVVVGLTNHTLLIAKDGREIPIADSGAPTYDENGAFSGVVLVFRDQTYERTTQKALRDNEAYVRTILDNLPIGVAMNSTDPAITFNYMNDNFVRFYRTTREAIAQPDAFWDAVYEDAEFRERIKHRILEDITSGDPARMYWPDVPITRNGEATTYISAQNIPIHGKQWVLSTVWDTTERKRAEDELLKLSRAVEYSPSIVYITDADGKLEYVNSKFAHITGYAVEEALGRVPRILDPREISPGEYEERWRTIRSGGEWRGEFKNRKRTGEPFWEYASISSIKDKTGAISHYVLVMEDITDRKLAEQKIDAQRLMADALVDITATLNRSLDVDEILEQIISRVKHVVPHSGANLMFVDTEKNVARVVRYCSCYAENNLPHPQLGALQSFASIPIIQTMIAQARPLAIPNVDDHPEWVTAPDMEWIRSYACAPILVDEHIIGFINVDSNIPGFFQHEHAIRLQALADQAAIAIRNAQLYQELASYSEDLEQAVAERTEQLQQSTERLESILNSNSDVILLARRNGIIQQANPTFDQWFGRRDGEVFGQHLSKLILPEYIDLVMETLDSVFDRQLSQRIEIVTRRDDGTCVNTDMAIFPIQRTDGEVTSVVCSLRDITERKEIEQTLRQALAREIEVSDMRMRFLSMASHDLRNPLAVIRSGVDMLADYNDRLSAEKRVKKFKQIRTSIAHMVELLDDVLTIGQVEAGKLTFTPEVVDLEAFCHTLLGEIQTTIGAHHIFNFVCTGECSPCIADPKLMQHILFNLLSNAVKYSSAESTVTLELDYGADEITLRVRDEGIGIPEADMPRLFEAFHRASNVGVRSGTGLGLAIVKQSAELHGGTISCKTQEGLGTTFTVVFPTQARKVE